MWSFTDGFFRLEEHFGAFKDFPLRGAQASQFASAIT
jgi:hypothetical protein